MSSDEEYTAYVGGRLQWLRRTAYLLCQDWHRADDLVQTTITRLYVKWRRARAADDMDAYVRVILIRVFLAEQRAGWFSRVKVTSEPPDVLGDAAEPDLGQRPARRDVDGGEHVVPGLHAIGPFLTVGRHVGHPPPVGGGQARLRHTYSYRAWSGALVVPGFH
ncbi:sigma factor [Sphaerisporangium fuscum]|uniref:sigma factor n=1 Tax=Sphaerisporangium fuscum TaxID=2835868 RepID=UPI002029A593|nr:sigma factor [Sphaerisporangium fuscum]